MDTGWTLDTRRTGYYRWREWDVSAYVSARGSATECTWIRPIRPLRADNERVNWVKYNGSGAHGTVYTLCSSHYASMGKCTDDSWAFVRYRSRSHDNRTLWTFDNDTDCHWLPCTNRSHGPRRNCVSVRMASVTDFKCTYAILTTYTHTPALHNNLRSNNYCTSKYLATIHNYICKQYIQSFRKPTENLNKCRTMVLTIGLTKYNSCNMMQADV